MPAFVEIQKVGVTAQFADHVVAQSADTRHKLQFGVSSIKDAIFDCGGKVRSGALEMFKVKVNARFRLLVTPQLCAANLARVGKKLNELENYL